MRESMLARVGFREVVRVRVGEVVMLSIMAWQDDSGCHRRMIWRSHADALLGGG